VDLTQLSFLGDCSRSQLLGKPRLLAEEVFKFLPKSFGHAFFEFKESWFVVSNPNDDDFLFAECGGPQVTFWKGSSAQKSGNAVEPRMW
jgi:hypothetical protein